MQNPILLMIMLSILNECMYKQISAHNVKDKILMFLKKEEDLKPRKPSIVVCYIDVHLFMVFDTLKDP